MMIGSALLKLPERKTFSYALVFVAFLAFCLQVQVTVFQSFDYSGIRLNFADVFLPASGLFVLVTLWMQRSRWPRWSMPYMRGWLAALVFVMSAALLNGYFVNDGFSSWALFNKYIGFFILLAYFLLGGWIVSNFSKDDEGVYRVFSFVFVGFLTAVLVLSIGCMIFPVCTDFGEYPWGGFMANRNAFAVVFVFAMTLIISYRGGLGLKAPWMRWVELVFWIALPAFLYYNGSRTGWVVVALLFVFMSVKDIRYTLRCAVPLLVAGMTLVFTLYHFVPEQKSQSHRQFNHIVHAVSQYDVAYQGDQKRLIALEDGMELYLRENVLIGSGLGTYQTFQSEKRGKFIDIIDFTGLWLLVEMGALGLIVFSGFFVFVLKTLYCKGVWKNRPFQRAVFYFLCCFIVMSCLHELLYTRFLWLVMGMALAIPKTDKMKL